MKKFYFLALSAFMAATAMADNNWYISGPFNEFTPAGNDEWRLQPSEDDARVVAGTFYIPEGEFKFNLINYDSSDANERYFTPLVDYYNDTVNVTFTENLYTGTCGLAWSEYEENNYWIIQDWTGGEITVTVYNTSNNPKIEILNLTPDDEGDGDDNNGDDNNGDDNNGDDENGDDNNGDDNTGDDNTGDDNNGDDNNGDDNTGDDEGDGDDSSAVNTISSDVLQAPVFTINGVKVLDNSANINSLQKGIYIVNGKKVVVR